MRNGTYYLNNSGTKWVTYPKEKVLVYHAAKGYCKMRVPLYQYSFGNFGGFAFKYEGKTIRVLPENIDGLTVCFVDYKEKY